MFTVKWSYTQQSDEQKTEIMDPSPKTTEVHDKMSQVLKSCVLSELNA